MVGDLTVAQRHHGLACSAYPAKPLCGETQGCSWHEAEPRQSGRSWGNLPLGGKATRHAYCWFFFSDLRQSLAFLDLQIPQVTETPVRAVSPFTLIAACQDEDPIIEIKSTP